MSTPAENPRPSSGPRGIGAALLVFGVLGVRPLLGWLYPSGLVGDPIFTGLGLVAAIAFALWGLSLLCFGARPLVRKWSLSAAVLLLVLPVAAELLLRASFLIPGSPTRSPALYADPFTDDDYWRLHLRWVGTWELEETAIHPLLGWSQVPVTDTNPLGLKPATRERLRRHGRRRIVFYGDSFVAGAAAPPDQIPNYMDRQLPGVEVLDAGVGGYGVDQAFLLMRETADQVDDGVIVMGVMLMDLDRSVLTVRNGLKPRLIVDDGALRLAGTPIPRDQRQLIQGTGLELRSFAIGLAANVVRRIDIDALSARRAEKRQLNARIFAETRILCSELGHRLLYVIFYPERTLGVEGWRERFVIAELERLDLPFVDTKPILLEHCTRIGATAASLYTDHHHDGAANRIIGDAILAKLRELGFL